MEHPENNEAYKGLVVNAGIEQPSSVNPYLKNRPRRKKRELSVSDYVEGIVKGDVTVLSQAVTLVESVKPEHQAVAQEVIEKCLPYSGNSVRVGISGVPGAGKSTSIDVFGLHVLEEHGGKLAVLAIEESPAGTTTLPDDHDGTDVPEEERKTEDEASPTYEETPTVTPTETEPAAGSTNNSGQVYVPGFGYVENSGDNTGIESSA